MTLEQVELAMIDIEDLLEVFESDIRVKTRKDLPVILPKTISQSYCAFHCSALHMQKST
jgi:hypothetical protein